jgi:hypothetical protein
MTEINSSTKTVRQISPDQRGTDLAAGDKQLVWAYYGAFLITVVICLSPFKILGYVAPFVSVGWLFFMARSRQVRHRTLWIVALFLAVITFYVLVNSKFIVIGGLLAGITYGTFFFLGVVPVGRMGGKQLLNRITNLVAWILLVEGAVGILQAVVAAFETESFDLGNGDAVAGTINLSFTADGGFSNPMFASTTCFMLFALIPALIEKKRSIYIPFVLGAIAFVMASVVHLIIFAVIAAATAYLIFTPPVSGRAGRFRFVSVLFLVPLLAGVLLAENLVGLPGFATALADGDHPRAEVVHRALVEMPQEYAAMPLTGLGPGQFSSRAALIATGMYVGGITNPRSLPFLREQISAPLYDYLLDLWIRASDVERYGNSSTAKPFFSWISVFTEFGAPLFIGLFTYCFILVRRMRGFARTPEQKWLAASAGAGIIFFLLIGFQENYWEVPQAILLGLMLIQLMYANVVYGRVAQ